MTKNKPKAEKEATRGKYVSRSVYQKAVEENRRLLADIRILTADGISPDRILLSVKWREKFDKERQFNALLKEIATKMLNENKNKKHETD